MQTTTTRKTPKCCMHENISIEIQAWPLTHPLSFLIDLSNAYASSKNGIGKLGGMFGASSNPLASIRQRGWFVAIVSDLEETRRSSPFSTHRVTEILCFPATLHRIGILVECASVCAHVCVCAELV